MQKHKPSTSYHRHRPIYKRPLFYLFLLMVLALVAFFILRQPQEPKPTETPTATTSKHSEQSKPDSTANESTSTTTKTDTSTDSSVSPDGKTPEKYEGADPNTSGTITGTITAARFSGDKLIVRVNIDQYLSSGACTLTLSDGANQLTKTTNLVPVASTSSCEGFDIQSSELSNFSRPITINIDLVSGSKAGTITGRVE